MSDQIRIVHIKTGAVKFVSKNIPLKTIHRNGYIVQDVQEEAVTGAPFDEEKTTKPQAEKAPVPNPTFSGLDELSFTKLKERAKELEYPESEWKGLTSKDKMLEYHNSKTNPQI